jgi:chromosome segregation ATPase
MARFVLATIAMMSAGLLLLAGATGDLGSWPNKADSLREWLPNAPGGQRDLAQIGAERKQVGLEAEAPRQRPPSQVDATSAPAVTSGAIAPRNHDPQAQIIQGLQELAALGAEQDRARQNMQSLRQQQETAAANLTDLQSQVTRDRQELAEVKQNRDRLRQDIQSLTEQKQAETAATGELKAQIARGHQDLAEATAERDQMRQDIQSLTRQKQASAEAFSDLQSQMARQQQQVSTMTADRDQAQQALRTATEQVRSAAKETVDLKTEVARQQQQIASLVAERDRTAKADNSTADAARRDALRGEVNELQSRIGQARQELASLSAAEDRARREAPSMRQQIDPPAPADAVAPAAPRVQMSAGPAYDRRAMLHRHARARRISKPSDSPDAASGYEMQAQPLSTSRIGAGLY